MNIIIDAMGGDNAPLEIVKGALSAHARLDCDITLTGDETAIRAAAAQCGAAQLLRRGTQAYGIHWHTLFPPW